MVEQQQTHYTLAILAKQSAGVAFVGGTP